jgi:hypothetical protein
MFCNRLSTSTAMQRGMSTASHVFELPTDVPLSQSRFTPTSIKIAAMTPEACT